MIEFESYRARIAYVALEYATGHKTIDQLAKECGRSVPWVYARIRAAYQEAYCGKNADPADLAAGLRHWVNEHSQDRRPERDTPESFYRHERFKDTKPDRGPIDFREPVYFR